MFQHGVEPAPAHHVFAHAVAHAVAIADVVLRIAVIDDSAAA